MQTTSFNDINGPLIKHNLIKSLRYNHPCYISLMKKLYINGLYIYLQGYLDGTFFFVETNTKQTIINIIIRDNIFLNKEIIQHNVPFMNQQKRSNVVLLKKYIHRHHILYHVLYKYCSSFYVAQYALGNIS